MHPASANPMAHMLQQQQQQQQLSWSDQLWQTWSDTKRWNPQQLSSSNIMDYFCERSNPFYEKSCNNEQIRMQRLSFDHLFNMQGVEYVLLRWQEPILFVIRKQHRYSPNQVTPQSLYYIINGVVHAAPDLGSLFNSRLLTSSYHLQCAFNALNSSVRYHPTDGYSWAAPGQPDQQAQLPQSSSSSASATATTTTTTTTTASTVAKPLQQQPQQSSKPSKPSKPSASSASKKESSPYQRQRVDALLREWSAMFPAPHYPQQQHHLLHQQQQQQQQQQSQQTTTATIKKTPSS